MSMDLLHHQFCFPDFWPVAYQANQPLFVAIEKHHDFWRKISDESVSGQLQAVLHRMAVSVLNSFGGVLSLAANGYGVEGMKLARGIFETELNTDTGLSRMAFAPA